MGWTHSSSISRDSSSSDEECVANSDILRTSDIDAKNLVTDVPIKKCLSYLKEYPPYLQASKRIMTINDII